MPDERLAGLEADELAARTDRLSASPAATKADVEQT